MTVDVWGEKTAAAFLGVRVECAQCHKHPFDRWTQVDYRAYANVFTAVSFGVSPESKKAFDEENAERKKKSDQKNQIAPIREVYIAAGAGGKGRRGGRAAGPRHRQAAGTQGAGRAGDRGQGRRRPAPGPVRLDARPDNPFFARSFANRVWGHYFGVGIVDPVDNFSLANPPSNPKLLDALARDFVESKFDVRRLERTILNSRTYQLSSNANPNNKLDRTNYSHAYLRPMMAEVMVDVLDDAVGVKEKFGNDGPPDCRAIEIGASRVQGSERLRLPRLRPADPRQHLRLRAVVGAGATQTLYLMADDTLYARINEPDNRLKRTLADHKDDNEALDELFLAAVAASRPTRSGRSSRPTANRTRTAGPRSPTPCGRW